MPEANQSRQPTPRVRLAAWQKGLYRREGKEYVVPDGNVLLFKFNV